jgi:hypothetical protein
MVLSRRPAIPLDGSPKKADEPEGTIAIGEGRTLLKLEAGPFWGSLLQVALSKGPRVLFE